MNVENEEGNFTNRSNDPIRIFIDSFNTEKLGEHYKFYLNLDAQFDTYDIYFQIRKVQCTYSWYNINESNNMITLNNHNFDIPPGNYNPYNLISILNIHKTWGGLEIIWVFDPHTCKITVSSEHHFLWGETTTAYKLLGFSQIPSHSSHIYTSDQLVDVTPIKAINFHLLSVPSRSFALYKEKELSRYLCTLFVGNSAPFTTLESKDETPFQESSLQHKVRSLEISIYDQNGDIIDLQNGSFQMSLEFTFRPKKVWRLSEFSEVD